MEDQFLMTLMETGGVSGIVAGCVAFVMRWLTQKATRLLIKENGEVTAENQILGQSLVSTRRALRRANSRLLKAGLEPIMTKSTTLRLEDLEGADDERDKPAEEEEETSN